MTELLDRAFLEAARLPALEQDVLAARILAELQDEDAFDRAIAGTADKLAVLAERALEEYRAGLTEPLDPDKL